MDIQWLKTIYSGQMSELMLTRWREIWGRAGYNLFGWLGVLRDIGLWLGDDKDMDAVWNGINGKGSSGLVSEWVSVGERWWEWYRWRKKLPVNESGVSDMNDSDVQGVVRRGDCYDDN